MFGLFGSDMTELWQTDMGERWKTMEAGRRRAEKMKQLLQWREGATPYILNSLYVLTAVVNTE